MRKLTTALCLAVILCAFASGAHSQVYQWQQLTPTDAIQMVRNFEGNPNLKVVVTEMPPPNPGGPSTDFGYTLVAGRYEYTVDEYTPDDFDRMDTLSYEDDKFYGQPFDPKVLSPLAMSQSTAQAIARAFMLLHYPEPGILNAVKVEPQYDISYDPTESGFIQSYAFSFYQDLGAGITAPSGCYVVVDTIKGQVTSYSSTHFPVLIPIRPALTGDQAMALAFDTLHVTDGVPEGVQTLGISAPDSMGGEEMVYGLKFAGTPAGRDYNRAYWVSMDANTGEIYACDGVHSAGGKVKEATSESFLNLCRQMANFNLSTAKKLKFYWHNGKADLVYPPRLIHNLAYMDASYLCYGFPQTKLTQAQNKQVTVNGANRQISFTLNSLSYQVNGQTKQMSAKPALINGRCYVPLDVMNAVLPGKFRYEAKAQTVRYDPPQQTQASK